MKKLVFIMPFMAISLLASCGGGGKTYNVTVGESEHLNFTTLDGSELNNSKAYENKDFKFKMKADNPALFIVPSVIDIRINDMDPLLEGYTINNISETEAEVTILASKIIGDIAISGAAMSNGCYQYEVPYVFGLKEIATDVHKKDEGDLVITFVPKEKENDNEAYIYPKAKNIYIKFDNCPVGEKKQWVSPAEDLPNINEYCSYNNSTGELTIKSDHIRTNIVIVARASDYPLLDKLSWKNISNISFSGIAEYIFELGEEKIVKVNGLDHKVRIIGFNHDYSELPDDGSDPDPNKVLGITFEFVDVITDSNGDAVSTSWDGLRNYDYRKSILNNFLNNDVLNMLPSSGDLSNPDLREVIKQVDKKVGVGTNYAATSFDGSTYPYPYLFSLAYEEIIDSKGGGVAKDEGSMYQYYLDHPNTDDRIKRKAGSETENEGNYWLRSPCTYRADLAWFIYLFDEPHSGIVNSYSEPVAPAFCI